MTMKRIALSVVLAAAAILLGSWMFFLRAPGLDTESVVEQNREQDQLDDLEVRAEQGRVRAERDRAAHVLQAQRLRQDLAEQEAKARVGAK